MSGGSQHNPNGRQSQLGSGWSPLQVANLLARAPQAHMASDRGVTWHTPTPPPHLYHVPAPSPPDPLQGLLQLQALKSSSNSVFRHTATPPELYRHTPTPPDKHLMRHTPSPGDMKTPTLPPVDLYQHLGSSRDKLRADELLAYARGVDLSLGGGRASNGAATSPAPPGAGPPAPPALSVRDAPTINSLIARAAPRPPHARVDALLERLAPAPASPHSVIVHPRAVPTPSPPSTDDEPEPGAKRKRKPERVLRGPAPPPPAPAAQLEPEPAAAPSNGAAKHSPAAPPPSSLENGDTAHAKTNGPDERPPSPHADQPHARRKTRSGSAETIADIAAMIADTDRAGAAPLPPPPEPPAALSVDKLRSVLASPDAPRAEPAARAEPQDAPEPPPAVAAPPPSTPAPPAPPPASAAAPRRRSARTSNPEAPNVPVESPSEAKPAEPEASDASTAEPAAASFVEVENQLEKMFAGLEEEPLAESAGPGADGAEASDATGAATPKAARKRRRSAPARPERRGARGPRAAPHSSDDTPRKKQQKKNQDARRPRKGPREASAKDAYDSGSNASSSKSRGPYIQIRGPRDSPLSVSVMNTSTGEEEEAGARRKGGEEFRGVRGARGGRGLHASTLGLRYDATTPDATWLCAFCQRGPHAAALGDLFGPYRLDRDCDEFRSLDEATRQRYCSEATGADGAEEVWFHEACGVWAPGLVAAGARLWGLAPAVWGARAARCAACAGPGAALACRARGCRARAHLPCAAPPPGAAPPPSAAPLPGAAPPHAPAAWSLRDDFRALCPAHAPAAAPATPPA